MHSAKEIKIVSINVNMGRIELQIGYDNRLAIRVYPWLMDRDSLKDLYYVLDWFIDPIQCSITDDTDHEILKAVNEKLLKLARYSMVCYLPSLFVEQEADIGIKTCNLFCHLINIDELEKYGELMSRTVR